MERCVRSICAAEVPKKRENVRVLIVDDGSISDILIQELHRMLEVRGIQLSYVRKESDPGLFQSRLLSLSVTTDDVILFLDDDVELMPDYLARLAEVYETNNDLAGAGGIDILTQKLVWWRRLYGRCFCYDSGNPGKLSASAGSWSFQYWSQQSAPFFTEFLSGCNMSFRTDRLRNVHSSSWLRGYSVGEDIVLSVLASRSGPLLIDPHLRVKHHRTRASRDHREDVAYTLAVNQFHLVELRSRRWWNYAAFFWMALGHLLKNSVRPGRQKEALAYLRGVIDSALLSRSPERATEHL